MPALVMAADKSDEQVTHHHRKSIVPMTDTELRMLRAPDDHNYGAADFVRQGAKLVVPDQFTSYWKNIPGVQFATSR